MFRRMIYLVLIVAGFINMGSAFAASGAAAADSLPVWTQGVGAKTTPQGQHLFRVNDYGAVPDGTTMNTEAIQAAIDSCTGAGGGIVTFAPGSYLTGSVFVRENVHLRIDKDVTILGSQDISDYREIDTRVAGIEMRWPAGLINVLHTKNVVITGEGIIHAQGKPFWDDYWKTRRVYEQKGLRWIVDYDVKRPRTILVQDSHNVTLQGITLKQAGFWTVHILYSQYVTVDGLIIRNNIGGDGPSTDGIDIDSSTFILVENADIDCNDDDIVLKAGRDADGIRVDRPTEYVLIRDCLSRAGGGLITFGSETSGSIRHVAAHNLQAQGTGVGIRFKSARTRGGTVEDILISDIQMQEVGTFLEVSLNWNPSYSYSSLPEGYDYDSIPEHWKTMLEKVEPPELGIPTIRDVHLSDITVSGARRAFDISATEQAQATDFVLSNVDIQAQTAGRIRYARDWTFQNVDLEAADGQPVTVEHSRNVRF